MPIYEYMCDQCGHHLEALQKISEELLVYCPECGEATLRKKVSAAAFRLKGTGWYETDFKYAEKEKKKEAGKDKSDSSAEQKSGKEVGAPSGDSKTETSSESKTGSSKSETKPAMKSGGADSTGGSSKSSSGTAPGSD